MVKKRRLQVDRVALQGVVPGNAIIELLSDQVLIEWQASFDSELLQTARFSDVLLTAVDTEEGIGEFLRGV